MHASTIPPHEWPFPHQDCALKQVLRGGLVTLVTAARDLDGSYVAVLARLLS